MGSASHRHEAAKRARRYVRQSWRNARVFGDPPRLDPADAMISARLDGASPLLVAMVGCWVKALRRGQPWPYESDMSAIERKAMADFSRLLPSATARWTACPAIPPQPDPQPDKAARIAYALHCAALAAHEAREHSAQGYSPEGEAFASHLLAQVSAYRAGQSGAIPEFLRRYLP